VSGPVGTGKTMKQKTANATDTDVERIILRDFSKSDSKTAKLILSNYKAGGAKEKNRVYVSALKLSAGDVDLLEKYVQRANVDYRDIIALSEYPNYTKYMLDDEFSGKKKAKLIDDDWRQFQEWFLK